ncbi:PH domain-containing protein [Streptomyces cellostaticus]|uniref:PH domain-containing protein n=1 Tax=Streptomyces cellostaticus TaxID=67285 RepID=UPI002025D39E|nr:PH domain-containing protein [Streptomyces cellostaticus]
MTTPDHRSPESRPTAKDVIYRSPLALVAGVLLLVLACWLGFDALVRGHGRTPWLALAALILAVPLVVAFTLRPAVFSGEDRLRVRNPFRSVTLPWGEVASLRSGYTNEVVANSGDKYQLWAIPVSLRARKKAARRQARADAAARGGRSGAFGFGGAFGGLVDHDGPTRAESDRIIDDLRATAERRGPASTAQGEVTVRWAYELIAPAVAGAVLLVVLLAVG